MSRERRIAALRERISAWVGAAAMVLVLASPDLARACAVCTAGREEENQLSYLLTTIFMSVLPLAAVGTLGFVLWRRYQKLEAELAMRQEAASRGARPVAAASGEPLVQSPRT